MNLYSNHDKDILKLGTQNKSSNQILLVGPVFGIIVHAMHRNRISDVKNRCTCCNKFSYSIMNAYTFEELLVVILQ